MSTVLDLWEIQVGKLFLQSHPLSLSLSLSLSLHSSVQFSVYYHPTGVPGEPIPVECEEDIFDIINFPYKKPEERSV